MAISLKRCKIGSKLLLTTNRNTYTIYALSIGTKINDLVQPVLYSIPQGSVLRLLLYVLYKAELHQLVECHGVNLHQYADDWQLYLSIPVSDAAAAVSKLSTCLTDVNAWLSRSMWLGSSQLLNKIDIREVPVTSAHITVSDTAHDLGIIIDSRLTMADHVAAVCCSCYYQLRQLRSVAQSLSAEAVKAVVHAFILSRFDYCNSLLTGVNDGLLRHLQSVQNAAACLVTGTWWCEHITPALWQLHWLPVWQRIHVSSTSWRVSPSMHCRAWRRISLSATVSRLPIPDGDLRGPPSDVSALCHVRTAPSAIDPSQLPVTAHGMNCHSVYLTLGYR